MKNSFSLKEREQAEEHLKRRREQEKRECKDCLKTLPLSQFKGRIIRHAEFLQVSFIRSCNTCYSKNNVRKVTEAKKKDADYRKACMYWGRSKKLGHPSDLKVRDIRLLLRCPCYYCGTPENECTITLDRKDSKLGYTKENTVPCCFRCNTLKSDMPWEAWKKLIPAVMNVGKLGLFREWRLRYPQK